MTAVLALTATALAWWTVASARANRPGPAAALGVILGITIAALIITAGGI